MGRKLHERRAPSNGQPRSAARRRRTLTARDERDRTRRTRAGRRARRPRRSGLRLDRRTTADCGPSGGAVAVLGRPAARKIESDQRICRPDGPRRRRRRKRPVSSSRSFRRARTGVRARRRRDVATRLRSNGPRQAAGRRPGSRCSCRGRCRANWCSCTRRRSTPVDANAEDVNVVVAGHASEVLCLFSRQLSDRELASLRARGRVRPADALRAHDCRQRRRRRTPARRRTGQQYLKGRNVPVERSSSFRRTNTPPHASRGGHPAGWNETEALRSTLEAHAEDTHGAARTTRPKARSGRARKLASGPQAGPKTGVSRAGFLARGADLGSVERSIAEARPPVRSHASKEYTRTSNRSILGPAFIAIGDGTSTFGRIAVEDGRIAAVLPADGPTDYPLPGGCSIAPGLIDVHTNGAGEYLFNRDQGNAGRRCGGRVRRAWARPDSSPA